MTFVFRFQQVNKTLFSFANVGYCIQTYYYITTLFLLQNLIKLILLFQINGVGFQNNYIIEKTFNLIDNNLYTTF